MRFLRLLLLLILAVAAFTLIHQFLQLRTWISAVIAIAIAAVTFSGQFFDFAKKPLELRKLWLENAKLKREAEQDKRAEEQAQRLVHLPTPDEVKEYGASYVEREIRRRYRREELDRLHVKIFIIDSREESDRP
ncbi:MAG TPA: hypothetical protein VHU83_12455 [Bryobacteraceae bacterium]|jgi:hypothetical protein|nr:hypothetical protein [Bryobacteraceae bacterium]